jgi:hypothetical protein
MMGTNRMTLAFWTSLWRDLAPVEQGSWGLFLVPLVIGIGVGRANPLGELLLTVSALGGFMMRRPALRWLRAFNRESLDAIRTLWPGRALAFSLLLLVGAGIPLLLLGRSQLIFVFTLAAALVLSEVYLESLREDHSLVSELATVWVLCLLAPSAYYVATGRLDAQAGALWALCAIYFSVCVADIRVRVARIRVAKGAAEPSLVTHRKAERTINTCLAVAAAVLLGVLQPAFAKSLWALLPLAIRPFRHRHLAVLNPTEIRSLGWAEVYFSIAFALLAILLV